MKKHSVFYLLIFAALGFITSCLGDSGQKILIGSYPGVVLKRNDSAKIYLRGGDVIYSSQASASVDDGDCLIVDFTLDYGRPENSDSGRAKGFLTVDAITMTPVPSRQLLNVWTDTSVVLPAEHVLSSIQERHALIQNRFFLFSEHRNNSYPLLFELSYKPDQERTDRVYDLFLRIRHEGEPAAAALPALQYNAFDLTDLRNREVGQDSLFFRIHYVQGFNKDSTQINWTSTSAYRFAL
jgi:hypothetical protein